MTFMTLNGSNDLFLFSVS